MVTLGAQRVYADLHEKEPYHDGSFGHWSETASEATPYRYDDGVSIYVAPFDLNPDENFLTDERAVPSGGS